MSNILFVINLTIYDCSSSDDYLYSSWQSVEWRGFAEPGSQALSPRGLAGWPTGDLHVGLLIQSRFESGKRQVNRERECSAPECVREIWPGGGGELIPSQSCRASRPHHVATLMLPETCNNNVVFVQCLQSYSGGLCASEEVGAAAVIRTIKN